MKKDRLIAQIKKIGNMSKDDILDYRVKISVSSVSDKARDYLYRTCDVSLKKFEQRREVMIDCGEFLPGEIE